MKVALTTLSNSLFESSRARLVESARKFGITDIYSFDFEEIRDTDFYYDNKELLDQQRGVGLWVWKPYILLEVLKKVEDGDVVIYCDAGIEIIDDPAPIVDICAKSEPILLFANGNFPNSYWVTGDCFTLMACNEPRYHNARHVDAAFVVIRKCRESEQFVSEWLHYVTDPQIMLGSPTISGKAESPEFREFRWDQSVLSLLAEKHHIKLHRMPTQFGNHYKAPEQRIVGEFNCINQANQKQVRFYSKDYFQNSPYPQILDHHRSRDGKAIISHPGKLSFVTRVRKFLGRKF
jgi:hypothetical protein